MKPPTVQDLLRACDWILHSPSFLTFYQSWEFPENFERTIDAKSLEVELEKIVHTLQETPLRMGRIFERLVWALFEANTEYQVLDTSVGIFDGKRQITELDLLVIQPNGRGLHLETAVKFYLYVEHNGRKRVVGSNGVDVLENRIRKFHRQLEEGAIYVHIHHRKLKFDHGILTRGRIFENENGPKCTHTLVSDDAERGIWGADEITPETHLMENRWEWLAWPPQYDGGTMQPSEDVQDAWIIRDGNPVHYLHLPSLSSFLSALDEESSL